MTENHKSRKREVNIDNLQKDQANSLVEQIGTEISSILDEAGSKCNKILNIYGYQIEIGYKMLKKTEKNKKNRPVKSVGNKG